MTSFEVTAEEIADKEIGLWKLRTVPLRKGESCLLVLNEQRRKLLRHLGMSRGDGEFAWGRRFCLLRSGLFSEFGT